LKGIGFANSKRAWVVGHDGTILTTNNGGRIWFTEDVGTSQNINKIQVIDETAAFAVGNLGLFLSYNGRPEVYLGINLWAIAGLVATVAGSIFLWRRYLITPSDRIRSKSYKRSDSWRSGWEHR
jgi:hypothetical protein